MGRWLDVAWLTLVCETTISNLGSIAAHAIR